MNDVRTGVIADIVRGRNVFVFASREVNFSRNWLFSYLFFAHLVGKLTSPLAKILLLPGSKPKPASRLDKSVCMDNIPGNLGGKTVRHSYDKVTEKRLHLRGKSVVFVA